MNKESIFIVLTILAFIVIGFIGWKFYKSNNLQNAQINTIIEPKSTTVDEQSDFTASFEIYTNGTRRIFTAAMYHDQSPDVFIQNPDPNTIYVKKSGITWADFFTTLPFSLTKECLITGTNETFCSTETQRLRFFLNDIETPEVLDAAIKPGDSLRVTYGN